MKRDWRIFLVVALAVAAIWGYIGYQLLSQYNLSDLTPASLGIALIGAALGGGLSAGYFFVNYKQSPRIEALKAAGGEKWERHSFAERLVESNRTLARLTHRISERYVNRLMQAGLSESPFRLAAETVTAIILGLGVGVPLGILAFIYLPRYTTIIPSPFGLVFAAILLLMPLILVLYPTIKLQSLLDDKKKGENDELPFFVTYASIMQTVGVNLYASMLTVIGSQTFRRIEQEALMLKRNVELFFKNQLEVIDEASRQSSNPNMRSLLSGYSSVWRSGGDMAAYLDAKQGDMLEDAKFRWRRYADSVTDIGEVMISVFFLIPMFVLTTAFLFPSQTLPTIAVTTFLVIPIFAIAVIFTVGRAQPKTYDIVKGDWKPAVVAGASTGTAVIVASGFSNLTIGIAAAIIAATLAYGLGVRRQRMEIKAVEDALPNFLRDMTEYKKIGYDIQQAIIKLAEESTYNKIFDRKLKTIAVQLSLNRRLSEADTNMRSWIGRVSFFLLGEIVESGGGTVQGMENVTNFITEMTRAKREARSQMRLYEILSYATPAGLAFAVSLMSALIKAFSGLFSVGHGVGLLGSFTATPGLSTAYTQIMIIVVALTMGLVTSKAVDFTLQNTLRISINVLIALVAIVLSSYAAQSVVGIASPPAG